MEQAEIFMRSAGSRTNILKEEHHYLLDKIEKLKGVLFLTGKAGTGKTTMLRIIQRLLDRNLIILSPTGIAGKPLLLRS